jgi:phenylpropionate dioxygenase-like ring-hydroxylating dioxygenase large terminal subunit
MLLRDGGVVADSKAHIAAKDLTYRGRGSGRTLQQVFADDTIGPPEAFLEVPEVQLGTADVSIDRYISREWHAAEVDKVWRKTWQVACRLEEIPAVGDYVVYDVVDDSVIVVRTAPDEIRAYYNACLHRGNALCLDAGNVREFRCPFHGFTWSLQGQLQRIPSQWDFQHIAAEEFCLPQAQVGEWGGFVFINMDPDCESLVDYLEILPAHLDGFRFDKRYIDLHVSMVVPCNWKVAQEAFIEGYHVAETHYEKDSEGNVDPDGIGAYTDDVMMQYDVWPNSRHVTRMTLASGVPSQHVIQHERSEQHIVDMMLRHLPDADRPKLAPGQKARPVLAEYNRQALGVRYGVDLAKHSDADMLDQVQYTLFPNFTFWPTLFGPLLYRFRPAGDNPDEALFEVYMLHPVPEDGRDYEVAKEIRLEPGADWSSVRELGGYGPILDQDTPNMRRLTKGLKTSRKPGATLANYQENRIRHFHKILDEYMGR